MKTKATKIPQHNESAVQLKDVIPKKDVKGGFLGKLTKKADRGVGRPV